MKNSPKTMADLDVDSAWEFHMEISREADEGGGDWYIASLVHDNGSGNHIAAISASFCDLDEKNRIYENWVLVFLSNLILDLAAVELVCDRKTLVIARATREGDEADGLFVMRKNHG